MARWLWSQALSRHRGALALALLLMAIEGGVLGLFAAMMEPMFDGVFVERRTDALWFVGLGVMGIFIARAVTSVAQRLILSRVAESVALHLRARLLDHLMRLDLAFHQANPPGALVERVQGDVQALGTLWSGIITGLGRDALSVVALFGVALSIDWRWTLIALVGIPVLVLPSLLMQRIVRRRATRAREVAAAMAVRLDEVFHGIAAVKLNALETWQNLRYGRLLADRRRAEVRAATGQAAIPALIDIMTGIGFFCVLIYGGGQIMAGTKTVGQFMAFFTAMSLVFEPLRRLGNLSGLWQAAGASVSRIRAVLDTPVGIMDPALPVPAPPGPPDILLEDVHLAYAGQPALRGLSFHAAAGKVTALVGPSGAGKSTVFHLLTRLVAPDQGQVLVGGVPVAAMALADLRRMVAVVTQDAALFDDSLRDNVLLGQAVEPRRLDGAVAAAQLADVIAALPAGLDSPAGPRGSALSGGQRQRVAIARALVRDAPVLLLDEATSALDTRSETAVQAALQGVAQGRTTIVIAHRLSTIRDADRIIVIDQGRVVEQGRHEELLQRGGLYADLHALQMREG